MPGIPRSVDIVVIGAGAAGLAAARRLSGKRLSGVPLTTLLIEARERIGGRGWTGAHAQGPLDLGCGWLHSGDRNPWTGIAEGLGHTVDRTPPPWGVQTGDLGFTPEEQAAFGEAYGATEERIEAAAREPADRAASELMQPGGRWNGLIDAVGTYVSGAEQARLSVHDLAAYEATDANWRISEGYGGTIAAYGAGLPVALGAPVTLIDHSGPRLRVETGLGVIEAAAVIVAVPASILAGEALRFHPALPAKVEAAAGLPLGLADKLFLALDDPEDVPADGQLIGRTDRVATGSYHLRPFGRPLIEAYYGGGLARELEAGGSAAFTAFALEELAGLLGAGVRTRLRPVAATAWGLDSHARGSYSHALPGHAGARAILAAPVDDRLFFAGEACSPHHFSTAHGAYETGLTAADAALAALGLPRAEAAA